MIVICALFYGGKEDNRLFVLLYCREVWELTDPIGLRVDKPLEWKGFGARSASLAELICEYLSACIKLKVKLTWVHKKVKPV